MVTESGITGSNGEKLREDTTFLNEVLNCIQDGISILDRDLNIVFVNKTMEKWYAHQMPLMGRKCFEAYHGRTEECEVCPSIQTLKSGEPVMETVPYTTEKGVEGWLELFTFPLKDSTTGRMKGVIEYVRDVTERKRAEEGWRESEERFRRLSEASFEGITIHDGEKVLAANKTFAEMFGFELPDVSGQDLDFVAPEYRDMLQKEERPFEAVCLKKDGTSFICKVRGKDIPYQGHEVRVSAIRDITKRKRAEEKLNKFAGDLQRSNRQLEEFAAVASHDLRSPLISVLSAMSLLEKCSRGKLDTEAEGYVSYTRETLTNMLSVIKGLLEYSRVGTSDSRFKPVDLEEIVEQSVANLMAEITESGAMVTYDRLPNIFGDAVMLVLLFQNLIGNAIKFRGDEAPGIHISAKKKEAGWLLTVQDNGTGVALQEVEKIFEIFHREKTKHKKHGTGIGLATCKKIVELHGGSISVKSKPRKGTTFYIIFPFAGDVEPQ
jgi:PAS domain S-box-containing protein